MHSGEAEEQTAAKTMWPFLWRAGNVERSYSGLGEWMGRTKWPLESCLTGFNWEHKAVGKFLVLLLDDTATNNIWTAHFVQLSVLYKKGSQPRKPLRNLIL